MLRIARKKKPVGDAKSALKEFLAHVFHVCQNLVPWKLQDVKEDIA